MKTCTIQLLDEVNCKLVGLDLDARKKLVKTFSYDIPGARFTPAVRLGRWDGKTAFAQLGGSTYVNLLPDIIPILEEYGYDFEIDDKRKPHQEFVFDAVDESSFSHCVWPLKHPLAGQPIMLRDYQVGAINQFLTTPQCLQEIATGAGKSIITASLASRCEKYGRTIIIVPSKGLVTQTEQDYLALQLDVGVFFGDRKEFGKTHTICTWQSLNSLLKNEEAVISIEEFLEDVVSVTVDECFAPNSMVLTPTGYVAIKHLGHGDQVINYSEKTKDFKVDTVIKQHKNLVDGQSEKLYKLEFDNDSIIEVTGNHKFLTTAGWIRADELTESHEIINKS